LEVKPAAGRDDTHRIFDVETPPAKVQGVDSVVTRLSGAPVPEPMPVVVNQVVAVTPAGRRPLPELVIEPGRRRRGLPTADRIAMVRVPAARVVDAPDLARAHGPDRLSQTRPGTALAPHLDDAIVLACRLDQQLALAGIVTARLLDVDVLPRAAGRD